MSTRVLIVEDEEILRFTFQSFLNKEGYDAATAEGFDQALQQIGESEPDIMFADIILGGRTGIDLLREIKEMGLKFPVVMITGRPNIDTATESVRLGAFDYLTKPVCKETLIKVAAQAARHKALMDERDRVLAENERYRLDMKSIFDSVQEGLITVDRDMRVIAANRAVESVLETPPGGMRGMRFAADGTPCMVACLPVLEEILTTRTAIPSHRVECRLGSRRKILLLTASPLVGPGEVFQGAVLVIRDITAMSEMEKELGERRQFHQMIGASQAMQKIYRLLEDLADSDTTALITGESGTGKELCADALHYTSARADKPLVKVNCSALPDTLLESELFGHTRGAFTGAHRDKIGRFELADQGTIFLDEIGDISPLAQVKLLRVLQEKEFERLGEVTPRRVDVRVITSTHRDLKEMVRKGRFREDLFYRLKVVEIHLPPLRERREDIPLLVDRFCGTFGRRFNRHIEGLSDEALRTLLAHSWPGNVRELKHALEHACVLCRGPVITRDHLPPEVTSAAALEAAALANGAGSVTTEEILQAIRVAGGNKAKAARALGISRRTLYRRLEDEDAKV